MTWFDFREYLYKIRECAEFRASRASMVVEGLVVIVGPKFLLVGISWATRKYISKT